jgi:ribose-phosphate pyrophosphokinase
MSPHDHYQDLKRVISAASSHAHRITVIMPFLYESRQDKRVKRESLDCAVALQELVAMGVSNIITFDAHDPRVANAIPLQGFDNFTPPYQFMKAILRRVKDLRIDKDHMMVISPDEGGMNRAIYFANVIGVDMGMFYKRRDYSVVMNGRSPITAHEFLGEGVPGKDIIVIDDMISTGESILDTARLLKEAGANRVFVCATFGMFTDGLQKFDEYYEKGYISYVVTTNLVYRSDELRNKPYYIEADMSKFLAMIIDCLNHDMSISHIMSPTNRIQDLLKRYQAE